MMRATYRSSEINQPRVVLYHVVGWTAFIAYEMSFVKLIVGVSDQESLFTAYVFPYLINIALFYFHAEAVLATCFNPEKRRVWLFPLLFLLECVAYLYLMGLNTALKTHFDLGAPLHDINKPLVLRQLWRGIYFIGWSSAYWFVMLAINREKQIRQMEKNEILMIAENHELEKNFVEMQYSYLQSQINPHLLFNTLNFIYNEVEESSQKASECVMLLAELMNYSLREIEPDGKVSLESEIEQIRRMVRINRLRFNDKLCLDMDFEGNFQELRFIPLGLLTFVENMLKHGDLTDRASPGKISITYNGREMEFITLNKKRHARKLFSHGIGVKNVTKRLDKMYPDAYTLTIEDSKDDYYLRLSVHLN